MVYKNDPSQKGEYIRRSILFFALYVLYAAVLLLAVPFAVNYLLTPDSPFPFDILGFFVALTALMGVLCYRINMKQYDGAELELTDEFIEYRIPGKKLISSKILLKDITGILTLPGIRDRKQLKIVSKCFRRLTISSYLTGFDAIKEQLELARPDLKSSSALHFIILKNLLTFASIILFGVGMFFCRPLMLIGLAILLIRTVFHVAIVCKSNYSKKIKVVSTTLWIVCAIPFSILTLIWYNGDMRRITFRKVPGEMRLHPWFINEINKYDKNGNCVYHKNFDEEEPEDYRKKFDAENREVYYNDLIEKYELWSEYDSKSGLLTHEYDSDGMETWYEYDDASGLATHGWDNDGWEMWREHNEEGKEIHYRSTNETGTFESWTSYEGSIVRYKNSNQFTRYTEYDGLGNIIHFHSIGNDDYDYEYWSEYDGGNEIHTRYNDGREVWKDYDGASRLLHERWLNDDENWYEYDENGNNIRHLSVRIDPETGSTETVEDRYEYNEQGDMIVYETGRPGVDVVYLYDYKYDKAGRVLKSFFSVEKKTTAVQE